MIFYNDDHVRTSRICFTCAHWSEKARKEQERCIEIHRRASPEERFVGLDHDRGWPISGTCAVDYQFVNVEIHGNASMTLEFEANFGCNYHKFKGKES